MRGDADGFDAILMDISMPGADGYEVARRLNAIPEVGQQVTYIAITGFGQPNDFKRSEEAGLLVYRLVDLGLMRTNPGDSIDDFNGVYAL